MSSAPLIGWLTVASIYSLLGVSYITRAESSQVFPRNQRWHVTDVISNIATSIKWVTRRYRKYCSRPWPRSSLCIRIINGLSPQGSIKCCILLWWLFECQKQHSDHPLTILSKYRLLNVCVWSDFIALSRIWCLSALQSDQLRATDCFCLVPIRLAAPLQDRKHKTPPPHLSSLISNKPLYQLLPEISFHINYWRSQIHVKARTSSAEPFKGTAAILFFFSPLLSPLFFSSLFFSPLVSEVIVQISCYCLSPSSLYVAFHLWGISWVLKEPLFWFPSPFSTLAPPQTYALFLSPPSHYNLDKFGIT